MALFTAPQNDAIGTSRHFAALQQSVGFGGIADMAYEKRGAGSRFSPRYLSNPEGWVLASFGADKTEAAPSDSDTHYLCVPFGLSGNRARMP
jgi:hypothetical protein